MRKTMSFPGGMGLMTVFAVLCLVSFGLLSFTTARSADRLGQKTAAVTDGYYRAEYEANCILAALRQGIVTDSVVRDGDVYAYDCMVSEYQALSVEVRVQDSDYEILSWQLVSVGSWEPEGNSHVWDGELEDVS